MRRKVKGEVERAIINWSKIRCNICTIRIFYLTFSQTQPIKVYSPRTFSVKLQFSALLIWSCYQVRFGHLFYCKYYLQGILHVFLVSDNIGFSEWAEHFMSKGYSLCEQSTLWVYFFSQIFYHKIFLSPW